MALKEIMKTIPQDLKNECDEAIFKVLIRTLKECNFIQHFKSMEEIVNRCYWSRRIYVNEAHKETLFQNISLWANDITKPEGGMIHNVSGNDLFSFSCMLKTNIVLQIWPKYGIYDKYFIRNFISTIYDCDARNCFEINNFLDFDKVNKAISYCIDSIKPEDISFMGNIKDIQRIMKQHGNTKNNRQEIS
jgi:hypothetical protein